MRALLIAAVVTLGFAPQVPGLAQAPQAPTPAAAPQEPKVQITFEAGGLVTLVANGATTREILAEWARQGGTTFVNAERLSGGPQTLQFEHQSETVVMGSILRQAAGYIPGPRRQGTRGASSVEVVYILASSNPSAGGYMSQPTMPQQQQVSTPGAPDDELAPVNGRGAPGPQPGQPPPPSNDYRPAVPSVAVPIVAQPPTTTTTPPTGGRGGDPGSAGSAGS